MSDEGLPARPAVKRPLALLEYELAPDDALILLRANAAAEDMLSISARQAAGQTIETVFPALAATDLPARYRQIARDGGSLERERVRYDDGRITGDYEIVALQSAPGRVTVLFTDVTETLRIERERERSRALLERVFEMIPEPLALTRHASGAYLDVNRAWVEVYGIPREEAIGRNAGELELWRDPAQREQLRERLRVQRYLRELELIFRRRDGREFPAVVSAALLDDPEGEIGIWLTRDVSPQRRLAAQLAATLENTPGVAIQWYDRHGTVLLWNAASEALYGIERDQALGRGIGDLIYTPAQTADFLRLLATVEATRQPHGPVETVIQRRDGAAIDVLYTVFMIPGEADEPVFVCMDLDVSQQRRAEAARRAGEARYRALFENARDAIFLLRGARVVDCNPAALAMFGARRAQLIHADVGELSPPTQPDGRDSRRAGEAAITAAQGGASQGFAWRHRRLDGQVFEAEVGLSRAEVLGESLTLALVRDVSERAAAEERARSLADRLAITAAATGIGFWEYDYVRHELRSDAQHKRLHGLAPDFAGDLYAAIRACAAPADVERMRLIAARTLSGEEPFSSGEFEIRWPDGSRHWILMRGQVVRDVAGKPLSHVGVTVDITATKRAELELRELAATLEARVTERSAELERATRELMQSEKLAALGRLVAGVAHELNTPIGNSLLVATGLADATRTLDAELAAGLRRSELDAYVDQARRSSALLRRNLERAAELIVSFKQVAVDQASAQRRRFALAQLVEEICTTFAPSLRSRTVSVEQQVPAGLMMDSYPGALGQVLTNLIANAVNHGFSESGAGRVLISAHASGDGMVLRVSDDGRGMAPEELARIFEPFYTSKLGQGGSGLGLPIVHSLVADVLGGRISVESEPGRGASFIVALPRVAPKAQALQRDAAPAHSEGRNPSTDR